MANRFYIGIDGANLSSANWSETSGGSGGATVPNNTTDVAIFDANSGSPTLTATFDVWQLNLANYPNGRKINIGNYNFTIRSNFTGNAFSPFSAGTGSLILGNSTTTATWTTNGVTIDTKVILPGTGIKTMVGNMTINGLVTVSASQAINGTGMSITYNGGATLGSSGLSGTSTAIMAGGTFRTTSVTSGAFGNPKIIDAGAGTVTFGTALRCTGNLTYISGTVVTTGSTYAQVAAAKITTVNGAASMEFEGFTQTGVAWSLGSDITINGLYTFGDSDRTVGHATYKIYAKGGCTAQGAYTTFSGQGLWIQGGVIKSGTNQGSILGNVHFDGNCSFYQAGAGVISTRFRNCNLYYNSGTVTTTDALVMVSGTCNSYVGENIIWDELVIGNASNSLTSTLTLSENLKCDTIYLSPSYMLSGATTTISIVDTKKLITREIYVSENEFTTATISSAGTGYLYCTGTFADRKIYGCIFTNIDASETTTPVYSWQGVVTNCLNVFAVDGQDIGGGGVSVTTY